jgi:hypothetical protein
MELISNSSRQNFLQQSEDPQSVEIRRKFGGNLEFIAKFNVNNQEYCAQNIERALEVGTPSLVQFGKAYGEDTVQNIITAHIANAIDSLNEYAKLGIDEIERLAKAIWINPKARILSMPSVIAFFFYLKLGYFKLYSGGVRNILESFNEYLNGALDNERQIKAQIEKERRQREREEWAKNCVPYEQSEHYKRTHENNPLKRLA